MKNQRKILSKQSRLLICAIVLFSCFSCKAETVTQETAIAQYGDVVRELQKSSQVLMEKAIEKPAACGGFVTQTEEGARLEETSLKVFVSFSMNETDLKALYAAVTKVGGQLLLRGLYQIEEERDKNVLLKPITGAAYAMFGPSDKKEVK